MKKVLIGCLGILLMLGLTVFWYLSRFDSDCLLYTSDAADD